MLDAKLAPLLVNPAKEVEWKCLQMVETTCCTNQIEKRVKERGLVVKSRTVTDLVKELRDEMEPFAEHLFNKD